MLKGFRWRSNGSKFVTDNSDYTGPLFCNCPRCLRWHKWIFKFLLLTSATATASPSKDWIISVSGSVPWLPRDRPGLTSATTTNVVLDPSDLILNSGPIHAVRDGADLPRVYFWYDCFLPLGVFPGCECKSFSRLWSPLTLLIDSAWVTSTFFFVFFFFCCDVFPKNAFCAFVHFSFFVFIFFFFFFF